MNLTIKTTEWIKCLWANLQKRNLNKNEYNKINGKEWISKSSLLRGLDEEINYLEERVKKANEGININVEMVESWVFQTKRIRNEIAKANTEVDKR